MSESNCLTRKLENDMFCFKTSSKAKDVKYYISKHARDKEQLSIDILSTIEQSIAYVYLMLYQLMHGRLTHR